MVAPQPPQEYQAAAVAGGERYDKGGKKKMNRHQGKRGTDNYGRDRDEKGNTEWGVLSVARFCYVFPRKLRGPAWAVSSYSISQSAGELPKTSSLKPCNR